MIELLVIVGVAAAFLVANDRKDRRHAEQVQELLQRIQAPEQAVIQHQIEHAGEGDRIMPLSDEEAAELERGRQEVLRMIEQEEQARTVFGG